MGRAILTTDAPGCRDTVLPGENGLVVPVRDVAALAQAMITLCDMPRDALQRMGLAPRARAEAVYDVVQVNRVIAAALLDPPCSGPDNLPACP